MEKFHISFSFFQRNISPSKQLQGGLGFSQKSWNELLSFLGLRLGLAPVMASEQQRILAYQAALEAMKSGAFYEKFYQNEPLGSAKFLLTYRDELIWYLKDLSKLKSTQRLKDFAGLEVNASKWRGFPDLMHEILEQLPLLNTLALTIQCEEPLALYPSYFQSFFQKLSQYGVEILEPPALESRARKGSNLHFIQQRLIGLFHKHEVTLPTPSSADGTLILHHPSNELLAAAELTEWLKDAGEFECLFPKEIVYEANALAASKQSLLKSKAKAYAQMAAQIFQSRISLLMQPTPLENIYDFLNLPLKPFNSILSNYMIRALQQNPSLESDEVLGQMDKAYTKIQEKYGDGACEKAKEQYLEWFSRPQSPILGYLTLESIIEKLVKLKAWAQGYSSALETSDDGIRATLIELVALCTDFILLLNQYAGNKEVISHEQLSKLVFQWLSTQNQDVGFFTKSQNAWTNHFVGNQDVSHLVWLNFSKSWSLATTNDKFQKIEFEELQYHSGKAWFMKKDEDRLLLYAQVRKLCSVQTSLKLSFTKSVGNQEQTPHLIWQFIKQELKSLLNELTWKPQALQISTRLKHWDGDTDWRNPSFEIPRLAALFPKRTSYSANKSLIYYPHVYLYERLLKLNADTNYALEFKSHHYGTLIHLFVEIYASPGTEKYPRSAIWDNFTNRAWQDLVDTHFEAFIKKQASFLFESKYAMQKDRLFYTLKFKLLQLFVPLLEQGWNLCDIEREIKVENFIQVITLVGKADMVWKKSQGEYLIVDIKTGSKSELKEELKENKAWQLMIYSHFGHPGKTVAKAAYYLTNTGKFLMGSSLGLSNEELVPLGPSAPNLDEIQLLEHYKRAIAIRLDQLVSGQVDFRVNETFNQELDQLPENPFKAQGHSQTDFSLESQPFKYDNYTFIQPDKYRYV